MKKLLAMIIMFQCGINVQAQSNEELEKQIRAQLEDVVYQYNNKLDTTLVVKDTARLFTDIGIVYVYPNSKIRVQQEFDIAMLKQKAMNRPYIYPTTNYPPSTVLQGSRGNLFGQHTIAPMNSGAERTSLILGISILVFGVIILILIFIILYKKSQGIGGMTLKALGLVIVVVAALFLIVAGFDEHQITPVVGLLGTIIGYLLASKEKDN